MAAPRTQITDLEVEVLANIFQYVADESPHTTASLAQVNKSFNSTVWLVRHRYKTLQWDSHLREYVTATGQAPDKWESPGFLRGLRHLTILRGDPFAGFQGNLAIVRLVELLTKVGSLRSLHWKAGCAPPKDVSVTLQKKHPRAELQVHRYARPATLLEPVVAEQALATCASLTAFSLYTDWFRCRLNHDAFATIIANAPNLTFASLVTLGFREDVFSAEPLFAGRQQSSSLRHLTLDGWPLSEFTLNYWAQYVDLKALESFKCSRGILESTYFTRASKVLVGLKSVSLNLGACVESEKTAKEATRYLGTCPPLTTLSLWSWMDRVPLGTLLQRHGSTLRELHLHEREEDTQTGMSEYLTLEELQTIRAACPHLQCFTFDMERKSKHLKIEHYLAILEELKRFGLDKLQIYVDSGLMYADYASPQERGEQALQIGVAHDDDDDNCGDPWAFPDARPFTREIPRDDGGTTILPFHPPPASQDIPRFAEELWKVVFGYRRQGERVLDLKFGEWERKVHSSLRNRPVSTLRAWCHAKPQERDDRLGECEVSVRRGGDMLLGVGVQNWEN